MKRITFEQFIRTFNFCRIDDTKRESYAQEDSCIVRINYPLGENFNDIIWFEFGVYDFFDKDNTWNICKKVLSDTILNSYIHHIRYNDEIDNGVTIYLTEDKDFDEEY